MTINKRVVNVLVDMLGVDDEEVTLEASLIEDLGADSLDLVEIIMGIEDEFDIEIEDSQAERIKTVGDIVTFVTNEMN